MDLDAA
jgi:DNA-binding Lrp family transcriptional regulator